jgi:LPS sulfotransferase NodH
VGQNLKSGKQTVELQPGEVRVSRIRRDPPPPPGATQRAFNSLRAYSDGWESWMVVTGVSFFAIALTIIAFAFSDYTS